jgi:predicted signal transduction protein with EAL and GGDEF domain
MAGWALSDVRGSRLLDVAAPPGNPDRDRWSALLDVALSGEESVAEEILSTVRGGQLVQTEVSMWPSTSEGGRVNVFIRNIADRVALVAQLREQALTDPLTGLPNRRALTEALAEASSSGERAALLFLDIDEFKVLNDAYGHGVGDQLLQAAAVRIGAAVAAIFPADRPARDGDRPARNGDRPVGGADILCARLGGDEFAVLLVGADCGRAELLADLLIATLAEPFELAAEAGAAVNVAASLGLARHDGQPVPVGGSGDLLADADLALYAAKAAGKSRWAEYDHALRETAIRRAAVERELRAGLPLGEIVPHYQPVVRIRDTAIVGVEALARWDHPTRGLLAPAAFIEVAEQSDLIIDLGASMLAQTCVQLAAWDRELGPLAPSYAAVNISARHLGRQELVLEIAELLRTHGLAPHRLVIEVTEAAIIEDTAVATRNLRGLAELGVRLAVDDFGTGHSSLARLGTLAVDILKIDRSFVVQMGNGGAPLVELTLGLARSLGLDVVAEGVETTTQHDHLDRLGCANAQGYLYARPSAPAEITEMCRERSRAATTR